MSVTFAEGFILLGVFTMLEGIVPTKRPFATGLVLVAVGVGLMYL